MRRFHYSQYADTADLVQLKGPQSISVCIPTLNESATLHEIIRIIRTELMDAIPLVDELLVIDSGSTDGTREMAAHAGARVFLSADIAPDTGSHLGKGENLWKALHASRGDIVCYIDGDISNFHSGFITGLIGPLLHDAEIDFVKAYYERPLSQGNESYASGGGRVSEILVRPILSIFYPELTSVLQPLSGEYAARRHLLESLPFPIGYGVEIAHLIDLAQKKHLHRLAQTDLVKRIHRNRDDGELGDTAFAILQVILRRLERDGKITLGQAVPTEHQRWLIDSFSAQLVSKHIPEPERPAIRP